MAIPDSEQLESFGAAATAIEAYFESRDLRPRGGLVAVIDTLRRAAENYEQQLAGHEVERPLFLKAPTTNGMPDPTIVALSEGQLLGAALAYFAGHPSVEIDGTLLTKELCAASPLRWLDAAKPLTLAYRIHSAAGGRLRLFGNQEAGRDIRWEHPEGTVISIECKTRFWDKFWDAPDRWLQWARSRLAQMRTGLLRHEPLRYAFMSLPGNLTLATAIQDSIEAFVKEIAEDVDLIGGLSGFGVAPTGYGLSNAGQAVAVNKAMFVDMPRKGRVIPPNEQMARDVFVTIFGHEPDQLPPLLAE